MVYCVLSTYNSTFFNGTSLNVTNVHQSLRALVEFALNQVIYPTELCTGFLCQLINLRVLHRRKIRSLSYTVYLKALSLTYLITIPLLATSVLRKLEFINPRSYATIFYYAHLEYYLENVFLFSGNLIVAALAAESLRGMLKPFQNMLIVSNIRSFTILSVIFVMTGIFLSPLPFTTHVEGPNENGLYCVVRHNSGLFKTVHHLSTSIFETLLLVVILGIYLCLFIEYRRIVGRHREGVLQLRQSRSTAFSNSRKAVVICLASVTAYLMSNLLSAIKESMYLVRHFRPNNSELHSFFNSTPGYIMKNVANVMLLFNFTLAVMLQYFASTQYREQTNIIFGGRNYRRKRSMSCALRSMAVTPQINHGIIVEQLEMRQPLQSNSSQEEEFV